MQPPTDERAATSDAAAAVHSFMQQRAAERDDDDDDDDDDETAAALAEAAALRKQRRAEEAGGNRVAAVLVDQAERAVERGALMEAIQRYTDALEKMPHNVDVLAARGMLCARIDKAHAALHDGELIVKLMPDWYQGHAICGSALYCMKLYAPSVEAYGRALSYAGGTAAEDGLRAALQDSQAKAGAYLRQAAVSGDVEALRRELGSQGVDPEAKDKEHGFTPLGLAAAAGRAECVALLLRHGADVESRDRYGKTPLIWAAAGGHEAVAQALIKGGAALRATDRSGWDPLMAACHSGHARLATVWMQDADLARAAQDGTTCLHAAARGGHSGLVQQLLRRGADPAARDRNGKRALELARAAKHAQTVETLLPVTPAVPS